MTCCPTWTRILGRSIEPVGGLDETLPPTKLAERKAELRRRMRDARVAIPEPSRHQLGRLIQDRLFELPAVHRARTLMLFASFGSEVPTSGLAERLRSEGRRESEDA